MKVNIKLPTWKNQWFVFVSGIYAPLTLVLFGNWMLSVASSFMVSVIDFLEQVKAISPEATLTFIYEQVLIPLNSSDGVWYSVLGILFMLLGALLSGYVLSRPDVQKLELGKLKFGSFVLTTLVSFIVIMLIVALANHLLYTPLIELRSSVNA